MKAQALTNEELVGRDQHMCHIPSFSSSSSHPTLYLYLGSTIRILFFSIFNLYDPKTKYKREDVEEERNVTDPNVNEVIISVVVSISFSFGFLQTTEFILRLHDGSYDSLYPHGISFYTPWNDGLTTFANGGADRSFYCLFIRSAPKPGSPISSYQSVK